MNYSVALKSLSVAKAEMEMESIIMVKNVFRKSFSSLSLCKHEINNPDFYRNAKCCSCSVNCAPFSQLMVQDPHLFPMVGPTVTIPQRWKNECWVVVPLEYVSNRVVSPPPQPHLFSSTYKLAYAWKFTFLLCTQIW